MARKNNQVRHVLRKLCEELEDKVEEIRGEAGFHALEALETENQDARQCREQALKLSARASAYVEVIELIRDRCPSCSGDLPGKIWTSAIQN